MATEEPAPAKKSGKKGLLVGILAVLLSVSAAIAGTLYMTGALGPSAGDPSDPTVDSAQSAAARPSSSSKREQAMYVDLSPPFVVNYSHDGDLRYVQLSVSAMARSEETLEAVEDHMPRIRNSLILMLGSQDFETIGTLEGKQKLQQLALQDIQAILREEALVPDLEAVYFTNFVMQ